MICSRIRSHFATGYIPKVGSSESRIVVVTFRISDEIKSESRNVDDPRFGISARKNRPGPGLIAENLDKRWRRSFRAFQVRQKVKLLISCNLLGWDIPRFGMSLQRTKIRISECRRGIAPGSGLISGSAGAGGAQRGRPPAMGDGCSRVDRRSPTTAAREPALETMPTAACPSRCRASYRRPIAPGATKTPAGLPGILRRGPRTNLATGLRSKS